MAKKKTRKPSKKNQIKLTPFLIIIIVVAVIVTVFFMYRAGKFDPLISSIKEKFGLVEETPAEEPVEEESPSEGNENQNPVVIGDGELSISFMELGNKYTGDSIYIKAGEYDILIDAGSRNASSTTISNYVNQYCTDNKLEIVIATHAHQDHIAGFVGTNANPGIFDLYQCDLIIDFPKTNATSAVYNNYVAKVNAEVEAGAKHFNALECYNNTDPENGAKRVFDLTEDIKMEILYNYYYEHDTSNENNYSVCVMFSHGERKFLLTGDLEAEGEEKLVENNSLSKVNVYKAGHHGSYTAGSDKLLEVIKPEKVVCCCCCGSTEYTSNPDNTFPAQAFIDRVFKYTKDVYVTTIATDAEPGYTSMNGNIMIISNKDALQLICSNNDTRLIDTEWFKNNWRWIDE